MARLEPAVRSGSLLKLYQSLWAPYYQAVLNVLGPTGVLLPLGDPHHGQPNATTFATKGEEQAAFTWSEPPSSFDTPLDLTAADSFQGIIPVVTFNGTDEEADTPDATYWSRGDGANDSPVSMGAWVNLADATSSMILSKFGSGASKEWQFGFDASDKLYFLARDASTGANVDRTADAATSEGKWSFVVLTYDGAAGASAMDTVVLYAEGGLWASTATNSGSYTAMGNKVVVVGLGVQNLTSSLFHGALAGGPLGPFFTQKELTSDEVRALYDLGRAALGL